ncbi:MAG: Asp-tRNA(Asn)/Glu-tRNA(Gln) amidotransferase subunit GatC [Myxococcaceae bacterium]
MKLELAQVRHVAKLARLSLTPDEEARLQHDLSKVLDAVDELAKVDTTGVPPTTFALHASGSAARPDVVQGELTVDQALANAPQKHADAFVIPKVIGGGE